MAATTNQLIEAQAAGGLIGVPVAASTTIYQGTMNFFNRTSGAQEGYLTGDDNGGANTFAGIARAEVDNSAGSAGDKDAELYTEGSFVLTGSGFTQANNGDIAYATDNYTVTPSSGSAVRIGRFVEYISATRMRVKIDVQETA